MSQVLSEEPHHLRRKGRSWSSHRLAEGALAAPTPLQGCNKTRPSAALTFLLDPAIERGGRDETCPPHDNSPRGVRPCRKSLSRGLDRLPVPRYTLCLHAGSCLSTAIHPPYGTAGVGGCACGRGGRSEETMSMSLRFLTGNSSLILQQCCNNCLQYP